MLLLEAFSTLVRDPNHWYFEFLAGGIQMLVVDGVVLTVAWPFIRRHIHNDVLRGKPEGGGEVLSPADGAMGRGNVVIYPRKKPVPRPPVRISTPDRRR